MCTPLPTGSLGVQRGQKAKNQRGQKEVFTSKTNKDKAKKNRNYQHTQQAECLEVGYLGVQIILASLEYLYTLPAQSINHMGIQTKLKFTFKNQTLNISVADIQAFLKPYTYIFEDSNVCLQLN